MLRMGFLFSCSGVLGLTLLLSEAERLSWESESTSIGTTGSALPQIDPDGAMVIKIRQEESALTLDVRVSHMELASETVRRVATEHPDASVVRVHFYLPGLVMGVDPPTATFTKSGEALTRIE